MSAVVDKVTYGTSLDNGTPYIRPPGSQRQGSLPLGPPQLVRQYNGFPPMLQTISAVKDPLAFKQVTAPPKEKDEGISIPSDDSSDDSSEDDGLVDELNKELLDEPYREKIRRLHGAKEPRHATPVQTDEEDWHRKTTGGKGPAPSLWAEAVKQAAKPEDDELNAAEEVAPGKGPVLKSEDEADRGELGEAYQPFPWSEAKPEANKHVELAEEVTPEDDEEDTEAAAEPEAKKLAQADEDAFMKGPPEDDKDFEDDIFDAMEDDDEDDEEDTEAAEHLKPEAESEAEPEESEAEPEAEPEADMEDDEEPKKLNKYEKMLIEAAKNLKNSRSKSLSSRGMQSASSEFSMLMHRIMTKSNNKRLQKKARNLLIAVANAQAEERAMKKRHKREIEDLFDTAMPVIMKRREQLMAMKKRKRTEPEAKRNKKRKKKHKKKRKKRRTE